MLGFLFCVFCCLTTISIEGKKSRAMDPLRDAERQRAKDHFPDKTGHLTDPVANRENNCATHNTLFLIHTNTQS